MKKIQVLICDDQSILADGIAQILTRSDQIEVVGKAYDGEQALALLESCHADVVLLDIRMPNMNGVVATQRIKASHPQTKVVILTTFDDREYIVDAISYGASGYLLKDVSSEVLIDSVINAYRGDMILPNKIAVKIAEAAKQVLDDRATKLKRAFELSDRESEVALMLYDGFTNRQIAAALKLSDGTARNYISSIYQKLECENRAGALNKIKNAL